MCQNILHAINKEEIYKNGAQVDTQTLRARIEHAKEELASPLVQFDLKNHIDRNQGITIYCYNTGLEKETGVYQQVVQWLKGQAGVDDPFYCSPFQIVFYYSFIGLSAAELLDYLHGPDVTLPMGDAFLSYEEMVMDIGRSQSGVTPHSSKDWHNLKYMPDPQKHYQFHQEICMGTAFLYAYLKGKITRNANGDEYRFQKKDGHRVEKKRLVDCLDTLYWDQNLFQEWSREMQIELYQQWSNGEDPINTLLDGKCLWELFWKCSRELNKHTWTEYWVDMMLRAGKRLVVECLGGVEELGRRSDWGNILVQEWEKLEQRIEAEQGKRSGDDARKSGISNQEILKEIEDFCLGVSL